MIKLVEDTISRDMLLKLSEWMLQENTPQLTKGPLTKQYERLWSDKCGTKHSVNVNSGSSAILLTLSALKQLNWLKNNKIVVPSLSWHTDVSSPLELGFQTYLCDCNKNDLSVDLTYLEHMFKLHDPAAFILVSVLGLVPDMDKVVELCKKYDVILLEDVCESLGSEYKGRKLGTFGLASFFSTYYGHHISTIEGGMISTDNEKLANMLLSIRNHGWDRDVSEQQKNAWRSENKVNEFESLYTFYNSGYNVRSTDLQAFIGIEQLKILDEVVKKRVNNFNIFKDKLKNVNDFEMLDYSYQINNKVSNFAFPLVSKHREKLILNLKQNNVECRPLIAGSMAKQPFWIKSRCYDPAQKLPNCDVVHKYGIYIPNNQNMTEQQIEFVCNVILKTIGE